jgi:hypothetical protein
MSGDPTNEVRGFYVRIPWEQNGDDALESAVGFEIKPGTPMSGLPQGDGAARC